MTLLKVSGVSKNLDGQVVLQNVSFTQQRLQKIAIAGETGSGKTTLLRIISGLAQPDSGEVLFAGERVIGPEEKLVPGHPRIAYLSQHSELAKSLRVEQVLEYANTLTGDEAQTLFEICEISHLLHRRTADLSGGEAQRIALARLLITSPDLLLLDEPFAHLDMVHKNILKAVVDAISSKLRITCILVSHDPSDILPWAHKVLVMREGRIIQKGTPEKVYREPANEYVAGLFGKYNLISEFSFTNKPNGASKVFIRPEDVTISTRKDNKAIKGLVSQKKYFGSYYELEVVAADNIITVRTGNARVQNGDIVYIGLSPRQK